MFRIINLYTVIDGGHLSRSHHKRLQRHDNILLADKMLHPPRTIPILNLSNVPPALASKILDNVQLGR